MNAITRQPRILVKAQSLGSQSALRFGAADIALDVQPLFHSIKAESGMGAVEPARWFQLAAAAEANEVNAWDLCHHVMRGGLGLTAATEPEFAEPDVIQSWSTGTPAEVAFAAASGCEQPKPPNPKLPSLPDFFWFRDGDHSQLQQARTTVGEPDERNRVRIAHFDTGYDPTHQTLPRHLRLDLQRNFVDGGDPKSAVDVSEGLIKNLGHGTGTLGILAGADVNGVPLGGAAFLDIVPVRVANAVVLFSNSSIAKAFDYVHGLNRANVTPVQVITMSMGGTASEAWADAVNALYEMGVFIVTAAGNNFGNLPTRNIVYPARFKRVVAACGIMSDRRPYADLPNFMMAGNYGPGSKMATALSGFTPNTPWAKFGCSTIVDHDGSGTSSATPQIAAAAALWIQKNREQLDRYPQAWMRVEAVREALFQSAVLPDPQLRSRLGNGALHASDALNRVPSTAGSLQQQPVDRASFSLLRVLTGLGIADDTSARQRMLELEALQLSQRSHDLEQLVADPDIAPEQVSAADRQRIIEALIATPGASSELRHALAGNSTKIHPVPTTAPVAWDKLQTAVAPQQPAPPVRYLRVFAFDPLMGTNVETMGLNETTLEICWEKNLKPGPVGEYLEVVDIDPVTGCAYAPVDLNQPFALSQRGLSPSEGNPQFHQQMVYAVAMKTVAHFEHALGRVALWAPRIVERDGEIVSYPVRRLRIYPHAIREANSFYSPEKKALLLGYMQASEAFAGENLPGGTVFCCLSHDIIAHETTHALLDGLHRYFQIPSNADVLAFHEAFADIVALFQHFTIPEALRDQIARTAGDLGKQNLLGQLAQQFGEALGNYGALRDAIGIWKDGVWHPAQPSPADYNAATEPHKRGAVLVAAVFEAFLSIYRVRSKDLVRLATGGTGVLPPGDIPYDLVNRLADEAAKAADHVLNICIRALDYCPPVDITFGDYLRALITADRDLVPDDKRGYRVAFIQAFRRRGIYPQGVRSLSAETLSWQGPEGSVPLGPVLAKMKLTWDLNADRVEAWQTSRENAKILHQMARRPCKSKRGSDSRCARVLSIANKTGSERSRRGAVSF